ncbi:LptF/LptG family permease [Flammeovirga kamogawensis]|uniref:LptF/LptG family permease n=1 Tax=Flammeovirga kamogawensis TaxID=373891 RepID=A0ABX8GVJ5_9BACT|nr:LptF/LptG family permease [Flammeovirga kamogawensis]MBB6464041.1 lipopolysaccharide export system permease protein [Flammeovirga kamogawensis]QWG07371.1 LptF/LptG family permease [Flammeovirga kamogawensis]TRX69186.1 YjgP/YjgQ family permease [Flammeovirga kamogawensis]
MKKLDKLLLKEYIGPFVLTSSIVLFIFWSQYMISKFVYFLGKDLGYDVYMELFFWFALALVPVALPLAVLLATLMTYGSLGQHSELTAIKGAGISLLRVLRPIFLFTIVVTLVQLVYNDTVVPQANLKAYSLLYDIKQTKPTINLKEGAFYDGLDGYSIKVASKDKDGEGIHDVIIYKHEGHRGNKEVILAKDGKMQLINDDTFLMLTLFNGNAYSEVEDKKSKAEIQYVHSEFDSSVFYFSMESYAMNETKEDLFMGHNLMKNRNQLETEQDSLQKAMVDYSNMLVKNGETQFYYRHTSQKGEHKKDKLTKKKYDPTKKENRLRIASSAYNSASSFYNVLKSNASRHKNQMREDVKYTLDQQKKVSSAIAILMMFLIGAPLGAIIKKGGLGVPVLVSVFFFVIYYIMTISGEKMAKELIIDPVLGAWLSNIFLFVIGIFFTFQAKNDVKLFDTDYYAVMFKKLFKK